MREPDHTGERAHSRFVSTSRVYLLTRCARECVSGVCVCVSSFFYMQFLFAIISLCVGNCNLLVDWKFSIHAIFFILVHNSHKCVRVRGRVAMYCISRRLASKNALGFVYPHSIVSGLAATGLVYTVHIPRNTYHAHTLAHSISNVCRTVFPSVH